MRKSSPCLTSTWSAPPSPKEGEGGTPPPPPKMLKNDVFAGGPEGVDKNMKNTPHFLRIYRKIDLAIDGL